jgi:hypothetical protein
VCLILINAGFFDKAIDFLKTSLVDSPSVTFLHPLVNMLQIEGNEFFLFCSFYIKILFIFMLCLFMFITMLYCIFLTYYIAKQVKLESTKKDFTLKLRVMTFSFFVHSTSKFCSFSCFICSCLLLCLIVFF